MCNRLLFVDDEEFVLAALLRRLECSYQTDGAVSGQDALHKLSLQPYACIFSDMQMPGMNGAALLQQVAKDYPSTTRFILTGHADADALQRAIVDANVHGVLFKPCKFNEIRSAIEDGLRAHKSWCKHGD